MRICSFFLFVLLMSSCDDGDFPELSFDFQDSVSNCDSTLFYITTSSRSEAYIIELLDGDLPEEAGEKSLGISGQRAVTYRVFDDAIGSDYFCNDLPPTSPLTIEEWLATGGSIVITTEEVENDQGEVSSYRYTLSVENTVLSFRDKKITQEVFQFGTFEMAVTTGS